LDNLHWGGKTDGINVYVFIMVKCCATETLILRECHQVFQWGVLTPLLPIPSFRSYNKTLTT